jgi:predicted DNA-binding transcriptional regulator AlpA
MPKRLSKRLSIAERKRKRQENAENARARRVETLPAPEALALKLPPLIDKKKLLEIIPLSYVHILALINKGEFPRPRDLHGKNVWPGAEVAAALDKLPLRRIKSDPQQ